METLPTAITRFRRLDRGTRVRCVITAALAVVVWLLLLLTVLGVIPS